MELSPCPECYCAVEVKYMSLHLLWHGGGDQESQEVGYMPNEYLTQDDYKDFRTEHTGGIPPFFGPNR